MCFQHPPALGKGVRVGKEGVATNPAETAPHNPGDFSVWCQHPGMPQRPTTGLPRQELLGAIEGRLFSYEVGGGSGSQRRGTTPPAPDPLCPAGAPVRRFGGGGQPAGMDLHPLRLRQQWEGHQGGDALVSSEDCPLGRELAADRCQGPGLGDEETGQAL